MGTPDVESVFRVPGLLYTGVTNLAIAAHYGGTSLGVIAEAVAIPAYTYEAVSAEEYGGEDIELIEMGSTWVFTATLREWDDDTIKAYFNTRAGTTRRVVVAPTSTRPGTKVSGATLLFAPQEPTKHPAFYAYRAIPLVAEAAAIQMALMEETVVTVMYRCLRDASNKTVNFGLLSDL